MRASLSARLFHFASSMPRLNLSTFSHVAV